MSSQYSILNQHESINFDTKNDNILNINDYESKSQKSLNPSSSLTKKKKIIFFSTGLIIFIFFILYCFFIKKKNDSNKIFLPSPIYINNNYYFYTLLNKIKYLGIKSKKKNLEKIFFSLTIGVGINNETMDNKGISKLVAKICMKASENYIFFSDEKKNLAEIFENLDISVGPEKTTFSGKIEKKFVKAFFEIFVDRLSKPIFAIEDIKKEINILNSEFEESYFLNDNIYFYKFLKFIGNKKSGIFADDFFFYDNLDIDFNDIRKDLKDFFKKFYNTEKMSLVIFCDTKNFLKDISSFFNLLKLHQFSIKIKNEIKIKEQEPFYKKSFGRVYYLNSPNKKNLFRLLFKINSTRKNIDFSVYKVFSIFLNFFGENSLKDILIKKKIIIKIEDKIFFENKNFAIYVISFELEKKMQNKSAIIFEKFFEFIRFLKNIENIKKIFELISLQAGNDFLYNSFNNFFDLNFFQKNSILKNLQNYSEILQDNNVQNIFTYKKIILKESWYRFNLFLDDLKPMNCIFFIENKNFKFEENDSKDFILNEIEKFNQNKEYKNEKIMENNIIKEEKKKIEIKKKDKFNEKDKIIFKDEKEEIKQSKSEEKDLLQNNGILDKSEEKENFNIINDKIKKPNFFEEKSTKSEETIINISNSEENEKIYYSDEKIEEEIKKDKFEKNYNSSFSDEDKISENSNESSISKEKKILNKKMNKNNSKEKVDNENLKKKKKKNSEQKIINNSEKKDKKKMLSKIDSKIKKFKMSKLKIKLDLLKKQLKESNNFSLTERKDAKEKIMILIQKTLKLTFYEKFFRNLKNITLRYSFGKKLFYFHQKIPKIFLKTFSKFLKQKNQKFEIGIGKDFPLYHLYRNYSNCNLPYFFQISGNYFYKKNESKNFPEIFSETEMKKKFLFTDKLLNLYFKKPEKNFLTNYKDFLDYKNCLYKEFFLDSKNSNLNLLYKSENFNIFHKLYRKTMQSKYILFTEIEIFDIKNIFSDFSKNKIKEHFLYFSIFCLYFEKIVHYKFWRDFLKGSTFICFLNLNKIVFKFEGFSNILSDFVKKVFFELKNLENFSEVNLEIFGNTKKIYLENIKEKYYFNNILDFVNEKIEILFNNFVINFFDKNERKKIKQKISELKISDFKKLIKSIKNEKNKFKFISIGDIKAKESLTINSELSKIIIKKKEKFIENKINSEEENSKNEKKKKKNHFRIFRKNAKNGHFMIRAKNSNSEDLVNLYFTIFYIGKLKKKYFTNYLVFIHFFKIHIKIYLKNKLKNGVIIKIEEKEILTVF